MREQAYHVVQACVYVNISKLQVELINVGKCKGLQMVPGQESNIEFLAIVPTKRTRETK